MLFNWPGKTRAPSSSTSRDASDEQPKGSDATTYVTDLASRRTDSEGPVDHPLRLSPSQLQQTVDASTFGFQTTADVSASLAGNASSGSPKKDLLDAGHLASGFNLFLIGKPGSKSLDLAKDRLKAAGRKAAAPNDWVYVNNFADIARPRALRVPEGRAPALADGLDHALRTLTEALPNAFSGEEYQLRRRGIEAEYPTRTDDVIRAMAEKAASQNVAMVRTPLGFSMAPMHDGRVVKPEVFNQLPTGMKREVEERIAALQAELASALKSAPIEEETRRSHIANLDKDVAKQTIEAALDELSEAFSDCPDVAEHLAALENDLVASALTFVAACSIREGHLSSALAAEHNLDDLISRYLVLALVSNGGTEGAPFLEDFDPGLTSLFGKTGSFPIASSDVGRPVVVPGAMLKANGGVLMIDAATMVHRPEVWSKLKATLKSQQLRFSRSDGRTSAALAPEPETVPLDLRVVLVGLRSIYEQLSRDDDFSYLFKSVVDADHEFSRPFDSDADIAHLIAKLVHQHDLTAISADGVAHLVAYARRTASLTPDHAIDVEELADAVRHGDFIARQDDRALVEAHDILRALELISGRRQIEQGGGGARLALHAQETNLPPQIGQAASLGFTAARIGGRTSIVRVQARSHLGQGGAHALVRTIDGHLHAESAHVPTLWSYVASQFAGTVPMSFGASIAHLNDGHQHGDLGASAVVELLALMSALSSIPARQDLAVVGGLDLWGKVQPVIGINERIETFFDACQQRGLSGTQGVVIPASNRAHLMLRDDVVKAVEDKWFSVYSVSHFDEALALVLGEDAGTLEAGEYPAQSIYGRAAVCLKQYAVSGDPSGAQGSAPRPIAKSGVEPRTDGRAA